MESLERRELMASDMAAFHNYLAPSDVDGDFQISPLDALIVINNLNSIGSGSLEGKAPPQNRNSLFDADGDNTLSPLDALTVINTLNRGEGVGELAQVKYEFYALNSDGTVGANLDPNPADFVSEAVVSTGQKFVVRTLMADLRAKPAGVFSAYHDLNYTNADASNVERLQLQWSEYNALKLTQSDPDALISGNFKLQYGSETTATIAIGTRTTSGGIVVPSQENTAINIKNALEALPGIGVGNVVVNVNSIDPDPGFNFDIFFKNQRARQDLPNAVIVANNLAVSVGTITPTISSQTNPSPTQAVVARAALDYTPIETQFPLYVNGPNGVLDETNVATGKRVLKTVGGFSNSSSPITGAAASNFFAIVDTAFVAGSAGVVNLAGTVSALPGQGSNADNLGIAMYNATGVYLTANQVVMPSATITIEDLLTARNDAYTISEDAGITSFVVTSNDTDKLGKDFGIVSVTQPAAGGTVTFDAGGTAKSLRFTPAANFNGQAVFTYKIRNTSNIESTASVVVTVNAVNDAPVIVNTSFSTAEDTAITITPSQIFSPGPSDESGQVVTLGIVSGPTAAQGTAELNQAGELVFTPAANFFGNVNITVLGTDNGSASGNSTQAVLTIAVTAVNDAPVIVGTSFSIAEDAASPLVITPAQLFTPGPANESSQTVTLSLVSTPGANQGTATILSNGSLQFTPAPNYFGTVNFQVQGTDNGTPPLSTTSTLTITVTPVNDGPDAVDDTGTSARFNAIGLTGTPSSLDVMRNDSPGPNESSIDSIRIKTFTTTTTKLGGTVGVNADRTRVIYTPPANAVNVVDSFEYTIEDTFGLSDKATTEVFIFPPVLPYAIDDSFTFAEKSSDTGVNFNVLGNDLLNDGATARLVAITKQPDAGKGTASIAGTEVLYSVPAHFYGNATIEYEMADSKPDSTSSKATVFVRVTEVNDPPVAEDRTVAGKEDTPQTVLGLTITSGLSKGPFEDDQVLTVTGATLLTAGAGVVSLSNGNINFAPTLNYNGNVLIEYTVTDNGTTNGVLDPKSAKAILTLVLEAVNDAPITTPKTFPAPGQPAFLEDSSLTIPVSSVIAGDQPGPANESSQTVSFVPLASPITSAKGGTITQVGSNLIYTPAKNFNGVDTFSYNISDDGTPPLSAVGIVSIVVAEKNDAPVADNLSRNVFAGVTTVLDLTEALAQMDKGAPNESNQTLKITRLILPNPFVGNISLNAAGTAITYFAPLGTNETVNFQYEIIDNGTTAGQPDPLTAIGTFAIKVLPFIPSSIKGTVFVDDNANNKLDQNSNGQQLELPVGGVEITLSYPDPENPSKKITVTEMTEADGTYDFELLPPGTYTVSYVNPVAMTESNTTVRSYTTTIAAPGDKNLVYNFPVLGINPSYGSSIEYLASSFYLKDSSLRSKGMYAVVNSTGYTEWTSKKDGYAGDLFHEVVLSNDGTRAYLTAVRGQNQVFTATLVEKKQFIKTPAGNGNTLIRVLAGSSDLVWTPVNMATPPVTANGYLQSVDQFFEQENWS